MTALTPAERILKSLGIEAPGEIDLEAIAWTRGAVVDYRPLDRCEATIVGSKRKVVIAVNSRSPPERRRELLGPSVLIRQLYPCNRQFLSTFGAKVKLVATDASTRF